MRKPDRRCSNDRYGKMLSKFTPVHLELRAIDAKLPPQGRVVNTCFRSFARPDLDGATLFREVGAGFQGLYRA